MPHFVVHCSADILENYSEEFINKEIHSVANASGLFDESDIKVRLQAFSTFLVGNEPSLSYMYLLA